MSADKSKEDGAPQVPGVEGTPISNFLDHLKIHRNQQIDLQDTLQAILETMTAEEAQKEISTIYWMHRNFSNTAIYIYGAVFQTKPSINPKQIELVCKTCTTLTPLTLASWCDWDTFDGKYCDECGNRKEWKNPNKSWPAYEKKIHHLRTMPYAEYLQTDHWKRLRQMVYDRDAFRCQLCNSNKSINAHHKTYKRRGCERLDDLIVLCRTCHERFHDIVKEG